MMMMKSAEKVRKKDAFFLNKEQSIRIILRLMTWSKSSKPVLSLSLSLSLSQTSISMASHHHHHYQQHHQQQQQQQQHSYPSCNGCCCNNNSSSFPPFPSSPPLHQSQLHTVVDPLIVQSIATQILQSSQNHLYPQQYLQQPPPPSPPPHKQQHKQQQQTRSLLTSLLRRIDALESSLHNLSVPPSPPPRLSLRDLAARTIQIHFRAFLVRRSRTLRNLKDLAFIKSSFNHLKSSLSGNNVHSHALSQKAMDLLLKLDSVQGGDPMIRDGKRSISKELVQFLEYVDGGISVKRKQISSKDNQKSINNTRDQSSRRVAATDKISSNRQVLGRNFTVHLKKVSDQDDQEIQGFSRVSEDDDDEEEEESQVEFDGFHPNNDQEEIPRNVNYRKGENSQAPNGISMKRQDLSLKPKKSVSFADNNGEKNSRAFQSSTQEEPFSSEDGDSSIDQLGVSGDDDQSELVEHLCREVEEIGGFSRVSEEEEDDDENDEEEEPQLEKRGSGERNPREKYVKTEVNHGLSKHGGFVFSPPQPVQMEPRKNNLRIVR